MLTVAKITAGSAEGYADYLQAKATSSRLGDYYLKDGERVEAPGRWVAGAQAVGADHTLAVSGGELRELLAVRRLDDGRPMRRAGSTGTMVAAIDATFSAPKSVSAAWALADPGLREQIEAAHERAVDRAVGYATRWVAMVRQRVDASTVEPRAAREVVATSWRHTTARGVAGRAPDPQLHSHVLLHGAVRSNGRVVAIDSRRWFSHRREVGAAYRTELARELHHLGFEISPGTGRGGRYFELAGIPATLTDHWSGRHHQVEEAITARLRDKQAALQAVIAADGPGAGDAARRLDQLTESGQFAAGEDRLMAAITRSRKPQLVTRADLDRHWLRAGQSAGMGAGRVEQLRSGRWTPVRAEDGELLERLIEFDATFAERDARAVAGNPLGWEGLAAKQRAIDPGMNRSTPS